MDVRLSAEGEHLRLNAPKGVLNENLRAQIAERKQELLEFLRTNNGSSKFLPPPIVPRKTGKAAPLSFAQERLWFLEQLEPQSAVYNICRAVRIGGKLNVSALEAGLNEIVHRHESLRTALRLVDGHAVQVVQPVESLAIDVVDLRSLTESEGDIEIKRLLKTEAEHPFDLHKGSLLRCKLLHIHDTEQILILITHHAASDAWSMGILTRELWKLYQAFSSDKPSPLEPLLVQYSDYAVWQREWIQGEVLQSQLSYWKEQLKELPILNFPTDRPRKPRQSFSGARLALAFTEELTRAVNELSHRRGVTPFMTLFAAFQVLLYRYSGQEDFALGSPIANRRRTEIEGVIGFFVNTLVLRADLSGNPSFTEVLSVVKKTCIGADANQDLPFEKLVQEIQPDRDQSRNPLFQVMFVLQNATRPFSGIPGLQIEPVETNATRSPFDLSLFLREREGRYIGFFEYCTDLFNHDRIERMVGHFQMLMKAIVANPDQPIATLPILTETERHQILVEWNDTGADYPKDKCIHQLFEEQVERSPERIAVEFEDQRITYRELNRRANQLAHYFISFGIGPEKLVGICIERSIEMVVGLLGILKAGGAYVPLDPSYPEERLQFMMQDARLSVLLTQAKVIENRGWRIEDGNHREPFETGRLRSENGDSPSSTLDHGPNIICLDRDWPLITHQAEDNPKRAGGSDNLAYVIYTSGSTGKPKGVQVEHRSVVNCLHSLTSRLGFNEHDVLLAVTTIAFDISVLELVLPLFIGGKVVVTSRDQAVDGRELRRLLKDVSATAMQATPSTWRLLLEAGWEGSPKFKILCGGEALPRDLAEALLTRGEVWNLYGPTESTIWSTVHKVELGEGPVLIGRPIANTRIYILDSHCQPVPIGVHGDLYIGGDGLARSYWNHPELAAERFIPDPFSHNATERLYRTGDWARYRPDGKIEFLGRLDNQVKIRGHRIELGEIESALLQHPEVRETVVIPFDEPASNSENQKPVPSRAEGPKTESPKSKIQNPKSLVAYVVTANKPEPSVSELRQFLQSKLPDYMIPSWFLFLDALPLTSNGKLDRRALPASAGARPYLDQSFVKPRTEVEEIVTQVWREVLKRDEIGVYDNFFDLGGHSLLGLRILIRIKEAFNKEVSIREFFAKPTIFELIKSFDNIHNSRTRLGLRSIPKVLRARVFPLSPAQRQLWILDRLFPGTYFLNIPYGYRLAGLLNVEALRKSLQTIIRRHEAFHLLFSERFGRPIQYIGSIPYVDLRTYDLRNISEPNRTAEFDRLSKNDASAAFDLEAGPLFRFHLVRLTDDEYALLATVHHIICDDWSMEIFRRELITLYDSFVKRKPSPLPPVPIRFVDFVCWQKKLSKSNFFKDQVAYWKEQLAEPPKKLIFGTQPKASNKWSFRTASQSIGIDQRQLQELRQVARSTHTTVFMLLLSVLKLVLYMQTGNRDILVGSTIANRDHPDTENLIGNFLNAIVLRTKISVGNTFTSFLDEVKTVCLESMGHGSVPFAEVAKALQNDVSKIHNTRLYQVMFIYQKRAFEAATCSGIMFAPLGDKYRRPEQTLLLTKLDLILELRDSSTTLTGNVIYKSNVIDDQTITDFISNWKMVLSCVLQDRNQTLTHITNRVRNSVTL